jgi:hypothetical protein
METVVLKWNFVKNFKDDYRVVTSLCVFSESESLCLPLSEHFKSTNAQ